MKTPAVKGLFAVTAAVVLAAFAADASASLTVNQVRQRYPWNGLVDIDYTIECAEGAFGVDDNLEVLMIDNSVTPAVTNRAITFLQAPLPMTPGKHRITWDANADGVTKYVENATFRVKITHYNAAYMVIDVSGGPNASVYPVKFLNAAPVGGFNKDECKGEYKGSNIVMRCIHPGSYMAGSPSSPAEANRAEAKEKQHRVALSQPYYIGIFEITQKQYENVMGASNNKSTYKGDYRPVEYVSWNQIRGGTWPNGNPASSSFMAKLRVKCKSKDANGDYTIDVTGFDLPSEFQWEYACRAGTIGAFNTTNAYNNAESDEQNEQMKLLGCFFGNGGETSFHMPVGSYVPNQWGLYDMHGNVWEKCLDWYVDDVSMEKQFVDPTGPATSGSLRVERGGSWGSSLGDCRSAARRGNSLDWYSPNIGFRLVRTLP